MTLPSFAESIIRGNDNSVSHKTPKDGYDYGEVTLH
jgi:hypothetical protein